MAQETTAADLPERWIQWLLQVEDPAFFQHRGVDLSSPGAGWTTLVQGLVKIHYPEPYKGWVGKPLQTLRAVVLDSTLDKDDLLLLVLHTAHFGRGADGPLRGFPAAADSIYGSRLRDLSDRQFLGLVAMLVAPNHFHPLHNPETHEERLRRIEALVAGRCSPRSWKDVYLEGCRVASRPSADLPLADSDESPSTVP